MVVIKIGGSLLAAGTLLPCLNKIERSYQGQDTVIVPGGGLFADQVRLVQQRWQFDDTTAHQMAILAMQQMALLFKGIKPEFVVVQSIDTLKNIQGRVSIWSPDLGELDAAGIQANWGVTSDSLSAWLAGQLGASELILLKSAAIDARLSLSELAKQNIVDREFVAFCSDAAFKITLIEAKNF